MHCYICPAGQVLYNGNCVNNNTISCPNGQVFDGYGCVCPKGYLSFGLSCVLDCGKNAYVSGNQCTCLPNYAISQGKCTAISTLCQPGFLYKGGKCQCPDGQIQISQYSCMPVTPTSCIGGVWSAQTSSCICPWYLYLDSQTYNCVPCNTADRQIAANGTCICAMTYQPVSGGCQQCPANTYYEPSLGTCAPITSYLTTPCLSNQFRDMNNYYQCSNCPVQCTTCVSLNVCTACANGYVIQPNQQNSGYQWGYPAGYNPSTGTTNQISGICVPGQQQNPYAYQYQFPQQQQQQYIQSQPIMPNYNINTQQAFAASATYTPIPGYYYAPPPYTAIGSTVTVNPTPSTPSYSNPTPSYLPNPTPIYQQPLLSTSIGTIALSTVAAPAASAPAASAPAASAPVVSAPVVSAPVVSTAGNLVGSSLSGSTSSDSSFVSTAPTSNTASSSNAASATTYTPTPLPTGN